MVKYKFEIPDEELYDFNLIVIKTTMEIYQFAYHLNDTLDIRLALTSKRIKLEDQSEYKIYYYDDEVNKLNWYLIENYVEVFEKVGIFDFILKETTLVEEYKNFKFILKIHGNFNQNFLKKIKEITQVVKVEPVDVLTLHNKEYFIQN